jgi:PAS domain-containing protein
MSAHVNLGQLTLLIAGAVVGAALLAGAIYAVHRSIRGSLKLETIAAPRVRAENEEAFTLAAMQGVIAQLRSEQKSAQEKLLAAEREADELARRLEVIVREMDQAVLIFNKQGFASGANPRARDVLGPDAWSHRRYPEMLAHLPKVAEWVGACLASGSEARKETAEFEPSEGQRPVRVSVLPLRNKSGAVDGAVCLIRFLREQSGAPAISS